MGVRSSAGRVERLLRGRPRDSLRSVFSDRQYAEAVLRSLIGNCRRDNLSHPQSARAPGSPGEYLVKFRAATDPSYAENTVRSAAFSTVRRFRSVPGLYRIVTNPGVAPQSAATRLAQDPAVAYIEPNFIVRGTTVPNDPLFLQLLGLEQHVATRRRHRG